MLIAGIILIFIGISALVEPWLTFINVIKYAGFALLLSGIFVIIHAITIKSIAGEAKWLIMEGGLDLVFGLTLILNPLLTVIAFPLLIGCWILLRGIIKIVASLTLSRLIKAWVFIFTIGIISAGFGLLMICLPFGRRNEIGLTMSIFSILMGVLYVYDAFRFRKMEDTIIAII